MIGYQYIIDLFKAILEHSKAIEGRFYLAHKYGLQDVNYDNLGETLDKLRTPKKYPLVVMAPPHSSMKVDSGLDEYRITLFFMKQTYTEDIIPNTKTSSHTIPQDWHDMKRAAISFIHVLNEVMRNSPQKFILHVNHNVLYIPLSLIGADRISGVRVDFDMSVFAGCVLEDYDDIPVINIEDDGHPEHNL